jgi:NDP-sugar pyrophosphorylase family protein
MTVYALALLLSASTPDAGGVNLDQCKITANKGDRVRKGGDVVVKAGEVVEDAVAVEGNVIVKSGATVKSAMALHGSVIVEDGATVKEGVVSVGGKTLVSKTASVGQGQLSLDASGLRLVSDDGHELEISAAFGGKSMARELLKPILAKLHDCDVAADGN